MTASKPNTAAVIRDIIDKINDDATELSLLAGRTAGPYLDSIKASTDELAQLVLLEEILHSTPLPS
ncbi:uncharacterized protein BKA78DRAFT_356899 [Phyllosticta capitalensis]|uniref:uncharacterized protein n=1 Tax=Phyllosticta capitalensis TaxID=121624 RepID=UPI00312DEE17